MIAGRCLRFVVVLLLVNCTGGRGPAGQNHKDDMTARASSDPALRDLLRTARTQSSTHFEAASLPVAGQVRAHVTAETSWAGLEPVEAFLLFEIAPEVAARAPAEVRAQAYCAALTALAADWWGLPYSPSTDADQRMIAIGPPAARCLRPLLENRTPLRYLEGEANVMAGDLAWTVGDLAAGLAAAITAQPWDGQAAPDARASARRAISAHLSTI